MNKSYSRNLSATSQKQVYFRFGPFHFRVPFRFGAFYDFISKLKGQYEVSDSVQVFEYILHRKF